MGSNLSARAGLKKDTNESDWYIQETYNELVHNVTWPTWEELQNNTVLVVVLSIILALTIFVMDKVFGRVVGGMDFSDIFTIFLID